MDSVHVAYFMTLSQHLSEVLRKSTETSTISAGLRIEGSKPRPEEHKAVPYVVLPALFNVSMGL
jgi:hypothetical protein